MAFSIPAAVASDVPRRVVAGWESMCRRCNPVLVILGAWAVLAIPLLFWRGFNSDEGVAVTIARSAIDGGHWLTPYMFDLRFVERPTLLSWIIAAISYPFGHVSQVTARLPIVLFLLLGCLLIYLLLRRVGTSTAAALTAVAVFLACPMVLRSYVMVTADMPLAVLLFLAFVLWGNGGAPTLGRWIAIGVVLALAALMKGPQPIAYFAFGVGLFVLRHRAWRQIPGLILAGAICVAPLFVWYLHVYAPGDESNWASFMRFHPATSLSGPFAEIVKLITEILPAVVLAGAALYVRGFRGAQSGRAPVAEALAYYAFAAAVIILIWPGGSTARYFFPMVLPLCALGGLGYEAIKIKRPEVLAPILVITTGLLSYGFVYSVIAAPLLPDKFRAAPIAAARIARAVEAAPAPIYRTGATALNVMPYVPSRIHSAPLTEIETLDGPAWLVLPPAQAQLIMAKRPGDVRQVLTQDGPDDWMLLRLNR